MRRFPCATRRWASEGRKGRAARQSIWRFAETSSNVFDVSPTGRNGRQATGSRSGSKQAGPGADSHRLTEPRPSQEAAERLLGWDHRESPSALVGWLTISDRRAGADLTPKHGSGKLEWLPRSGAGTTGCVKVRVRTLRTQQRVKNRCQLPRHEVGLSSHTTDDVVISERKSFG